LLLIKLAGKDKQTISVQEQWQMLSYLIVDQNAPYSQISLQPDRCPETLINSKKLQLKILHHDAERKQVFFTTKDTAT